MQRNKRLMLSTLDLAHVMSYALLLMDFIVFCHFTPVTSSVDLVPVWTALESPNSSKLQT